MALRTASECRAGDSFISQYAFLIIRAMIDSGRGDLRIKEPCAYDALCAIGASDRSMRSLDATCAWMCSSGRGPVAHVAFYLAVTKSLNRMWVESMLHEIVFVIDGISNTRWRAYEKWLIAACTHDQNAYGINLQLSPAQKTEAAKRRNAYRAVAYFGKIIRAKMQEPPHAHEHTYTHRCASSASVVA